MLERLYMNSKIKSILLFLLGISIVMSEDSLLSLSSGYVSSGDEIVISLSMDNTDEVAGLQFTLVDLPNVLQVTHMQITDRLDGYSVQFYEQPDGSVISLAYDLSGGVIEPGSGAILDITLLAGDVFTQTEVNLSFIDTYIGNLDADLMPSIWNSNSIIVSPANASEIYFDDMTLQLNEETAIAVNLFNEVPISGFQFHVNINPDYMTILDIGGTPRTSGWVISQGSNNVIGFTFGNNPIEPGDGPIAGLIVSADQVGEFTLCISDIILSDPLGIQLPAASQCGHYVVSEGMIGDINEDAVINVLDIVMMVDFILGGEPTPYEAWAADLNGDGIINVLDVVQLVQIIIGGTLLKGNPVTEAQLQLDENTVSMIADGPISGIQLAVSGAFSNLQSTLPDGWQLHYDNETIILFSMDGTSLSDNLLFEYTGSLTIESAIVADWHGNSVNAESILSTPEMFMMGSAYPNPFNPATTIQYSINADSQVNIVVYNMLGEAVQTLINEKQNSGSHVLTWNAVNQSSGVYMIQFQTEFGVEAQKVLLIK